MKTQEINHQWCLARRPVGQVRESDFEWCEAPLPVPGPGQLLVRNKYLSVDPVSRKWMWQDDTELPATPVGSVVRGITCGTVVRSRHRGYRVGTRVLGVMGWQDYSLSDGAPNTTLQLPDELHISPMMHMGLLGNVGITAYFGLTEIGQPKRGDTLVISSAAGAIGSLVGQIGKLYGCHVIGIAGTTEKCRWILNDLGFDGVINYKTEAVYKRLRALCPNGIDIFFDNVGGTMLEEALNLLNDHARVVACGMLSVYNDLGGLLTLPAGPNNLLNLTLKRARMEGFVSMDFWSRASEANEKLVQWHREGKLHYRVDVMDGLHQAPRALNRLFDGSSGGKMVVRIS